MFREFRVSLKFRELNMWERARVVTMKESSVKLVDNPSEICNSKNRGSLHVKKVKFSATVTEIKTYLIHPIQREHIKSKKTTK